MPHAWQSQRISTFRWHRWRRRCFFKLASQSEVLDDELLLLSESLLLLLSLLSLLPLLQSPLLLLSSSLTFVSLRCKSPTLVVAKGGDLLGLEPFVFVPLGPAADFFSAFDLRLGFTLGLRGCSASAWGVSASVVRAACVAPSLTTTAPEPAPSSTVSACNTFLVRFGPTPLAFAEDFANEASDAPSGAKSVSPA